MVVAGAVVVGAVVGGAGVVAAAAGEGASGEDDPEHPARARTAPAQDEAERET